MTMKQWKMDSPVGPIYLVATERGLRGIWWRQPGADVPVAASLRGEDGATRVLAAAARQLAEYFAGTRVEFDLPRDVEDGTEFQRAVWRELEKIPYGSTCSYRDLASRLGKPGAVRAVGTANGRNPLSILVPCHRVINAGGGLGGYAGGLPVKEKLLALERARGE